MSAPQPPNQPWGGEQQPQGPSSGPQPQQNSPFGTSEPTQVVQPQQPQQSQGEQQPFGDSPEPTQVVQPPNPASAGQQGDNAESTQLVAPGSQPQPAIPYAPPPSAADNPAAVNPQGGFGQQPVSGGFGAPGQLGPQSGPQPQQGFAGQPGQFGPPQGGFGAPAGGGFGGPPQPAFGGGAGGGGNKLKSLVAGGVVAVLAIVTAILAITLMSDLSGPGSSEIDEAVEQCVAAGAPEDMCRESVEQYADAAEGAPGYIWFYVIMVLVGGVLATASGVLLALLDKLKGGLRKLVAPFMLGGGFFTLLFSILLMIEFEGQITRVIFTMIFGLLITVAGVLALLPATAPFLGIGGPGGGGGGFPPPGQPGGFGQPGQPGGFGQPGQPGGFGQPGQPGGFGQPGGQFPSSGGFPQPGQPGQPGGFGQPGQPGGFGQPGQPGGFGQPGQPPQQW